MLRFSNFAPRRRIVAPPRALWHTQSHDRWIFSAEDYGAPQPALSARVNPAAQQFFCSYHDSFRIMSTSTAKLDFFISPIVSITSKSLIDNLNGFSMKPFTLSVVVGSHSLACSSLVTRHLSLFSNRPSPRLEIPVSYRKQRIGTISNRPKFALCNFRHLFFPASLRPCLFASSPLLIANDMHSREESSHCKQSTYKILIANEIHLLSAPKTFEINVNRPCNSANSAASSVFKTRRITLHSGATSLVH